MFFFSPFTYSGSRCKHYIGILSPYKTVKQNVTAKWYLLTTLSPKKYVNPIITLISGLVSSPPAHCHSKHMNGNSEFDIISTPLQSFLKASLLCSSIARKVLVRVGQTIDFDTEAEVFVQLVKSDSAIFLHL